MAEWEDAPAASGGGWESAPASAPKAPGFPYDAPGKTYGSVLPFAKDEKTGALEFAVPEMIRAPLRGAAEWGAALTGHRDMRDPVSPDMVAAVMGLGGARVAPGSGSFGPVTSQARGIPPGFNPVRNTEGAAVDKFGVPVSQKPIPEGYDPLRDVEKPPQRGYATTYERQAVPENYDPLGGRSAPVKPDVKIPAAEAVRAGYSLPPAMISDKPSLGSKLASGWAGKVKLAQAASARNQDVTDRLVAEDIGLPKGVALTKPALEAARNEAGKVYGDLVKTVPVIHGDEVFAKDVANLAMKNSPAAREFPELFAHGEVDKLSQSLARQQMSSEAAVQLVRQLRHDASANFRVRDNPEKAALGFAQRQAADALDSLIERNILQEEARQRFDPRIQRYLNQPDPRLKTLGKDYHEARTRIAKIHNVEDALISGTDHVAASRLAALEARGTPLTGKMKLVADTWHNFKRAMQNPEQFGSKEDYSVLDAFVAGEGLAAGHLGITGAVLGRPIVRNMLLRPGAQQSYVAPGVTHPKSAARLLITPPPNLSDAVNPPLVR